MRISLDAFLSAVVEDLIAVFQVGVAGSSRHLVEFTRHFIHAALNNRADCELDWLKGPFADADVEQLVVEELEQTSAHFTAKDLLLVLDNPANLQGAGINEAKI